MHRVVAPAGVDDQVRADQPGAAQVDQVGARLRQQPHRAGRAAGVDLLDAGGRPAADADVDIAADRHHPVDAAAAAVAEGVVAVEAAGGVAGDAVGVAAAGAVERVLAVVADEGVGAGAAVDDVVAIARVDHHVRAEDRRGAEVQRLRGALAEQAHRAGRTAAVDHLDAAEAAVAALDADVDIAAAHRDHPVGAGGGRAAVAPGVVALEAAGGAAGDAVGVAAAGAVERVVAPARQQRVGRGAAIDGVVAVVRVDDQVAAQQLHAAQVELRGVAVAVDAHRAGGAGRVDLLDAGERRAEVAQHADVDVARARRDDAVDAAAAAVAVDVMVLEARPAAGLAAGDAVGVAALAAVDPVVAAGRHQGVGAGAAPDRVVAVVAVDDDVAADQRRRAQVDDAGVAGVEQTHRAGRAAAVDHLDAAAGEALHADVDVARADRGDAVGAAAAAVAVDIVAEVAGRGIAGDAVQVAAVAAVDGVVAGVRLQDVGRARSGDRVVAAAGVDHQRAAGDRDLAQVEELGGVLAEQPRLAAADLRQVDLLDAGQRRAEAAARADVDAGAADRHDPVDAVGAAVAPAVVALEAAGLRAGDPEGVAAAGAVEHVLAPARHQRVGALAAVDGVVAMAGVDDDVAAEQRRRAQVDQVRGAAVDQAHRAGGAAAVDHLDAAVGEALDADVDVAVAIGGDRVGAAGAGVAVDVVALVAQRAGAAGAVEIAAVAAVEHVVALVALQDVGRARAGHRVVAVAGIDHQRAAEHRDIAQVEGLRGAFAEQAHLAAGLAQVDLLDAGQRRAEAAAHADVDAAAADRHDPVDAGRAAVAQAVVAAEAAGVGAADPVGVAARTTVEQVLVALAHEQVVARTTLERVVARAAPQGVVAVAALHRIVACVGEYLVRAGTTDQGFCGVAARYHRDHPRHTGNLYCTHPGKPCLFVQPNGRFRAMRSDLLRSSRPILPDSAPGTGLPDVGRGRTRNEKAVRLYPSRCRAGDTRATGEQPRSAAFRRDMCTQTGPSRQAGGAKTTRNGALPAGRRRGRRAGPALRQAGVRDMPDKRPGKYLMAIKY